MDLLFFTQSEAQTIRIGTALAGLLRPGDIVALHGELGAGKTRLVRGIAHGMGVAPGEVSSPTYIIAQEYAIRTHGRGTRDCPRLVHVDAYRLRGEDELESTGWDRLTAPDEATGCAPILLIEWAERIPGAIAGFIQRADVTLAHAATEGAIKNEPAEGTGTRDIHVSMPDSWAQRAGFNEFARHQSLPANPDRPATRCRVTGRPVPADSPTYPFYDDKARLADLNRWFTGEYTIAREITPNDDDLTA